MFVESLIVRFIRRQAILALAALFITLLTCAASGAGPRYVVTVIDPTAGLDIHAVAINNRNEVAFSKTVKSKRLPYVWRNGTIVPLESPTGLTQPGTTADINDSGAVVGVSNGFARLWNGRSAVNLFAATPYCRLAINNVKHVLGWEIESDNPVLWANGQATEIEGLPSDTFEAINDLDQILVNYSGLSTDGACVWDAGTVTELLPLAGCLGMCGTDLNNNGDVVGHCHNAEEYVPTLWRNGVPTEIPTLSYESWNEPKAINNNGVIVGDCDAGSWVYDGDHVHEVSLVDPQYWASELTDINDNGVILGAVGRVVGKWYSSYDVAILSPQIQVSIDVCPGVEPNELCPKATGVARVAVLTTDDFDASTIVVGTAVFAGASPRASSLADVDGDGDLDLLLQFRNSNLKLAAEDHRVELTGWTVNHHAIAGTDSAVIRGVAPAPVTRKLRYGYRILPVEPDSWLSASDINNLGQIVGLREPLNDAGVPVIIDLDGTITEIDMREAYTDLQAVAINDSGFVVGTQGDEWDDPSSWFWSEESGFGFYYPFDLFSSGSICGVSNSGTTAGTVYGSVPRAFRRTADERVEMLRLLPGCSSSWADSLNNRGTVVGGCSRDQSYQACYWDTRGTAHALKPPETRYKDYYAAAINDQGVIVGSWRDPSFGDEQACLWTPQGVFKNIGYLDYSPVVLTDINDTGLAVGRSEGVWPQEQVPCAWTQETGLIRLPCGEYFECTAVAVNDQGIIVGNADSDIIVWEPTPPTPVTLDIVPGVSRNVINLNARGTVQVAIITTPGFDADIVNGPTSTFAGARPTYWDMRDVDADGDKDLLLTFNIRDLKLGTASTTATLTAITKDDREVTGTDAVTVVRR